jgi:uncharacterized OB-fold protein
MSFCKSCGNKLAPSVSWCHGCGAPPDNGIRCRSCGGEVAPAVQICHHCFATGTAALGETDTARRVAYLVGMGALSAVSTVLLLVIAWFVFFR